MYEIKYTELKQNIIYNCYVIIDLLVHFWWGVVKSTKNKGPKF